MKGTTNAQSNDIYQQGTNYRWHKNGTLEQWGEVTYTSKNIGGGGNADEKDITFPLEYDDANYMLFITNRWKATQGDKWTTSSNNYATNGVRLSKVNSATYDINQNTSSLKWFTKGVKTITGGGGLKNALKRFLTIFKAPSRTPRGC